MIVTGSMDTNIRVWDPKNGKCLKVLEGHTHGVLCIIELETGFLASGSLDQSAIVWNPNSGKIMNMLEGFQNPIFGIFELDPKRLVVNFNEPLLLVWTWNAVAKIKTNTSTCIVGDSAITAITKKDTENILVG